MSIVKVAIINPVQMKNFNWMKNNPNMGPSVASKYDLLTNIAAQAKTDPTKLNAMRVAAKNLKASGLQKLDPSLLTKKPGLINKLKMLKPLAKAI